jgi:hypothetical protein
MTVTVPRWLRRASHGPRLLWQIARWGVPPRALLFGPLSLGDDLLCTAVLREARRRGEPFAMFTARPELFAGNPDPMRLLPIDDYFIAAVRRFGAHVVQPYYVRDDPRDGQRDRLPGRHIIAEMCALAGLHGEIALRPHFSLTESERAAGRLFPRQIALQSSGLAAAIPYDSKEWGPERFAEVARQLAPHANLVQLGAVSDYALPVDTDLRGGTTVRQAAAILAGSDVFVGLEGFLTHLARAVDCPAVVVMGGRAPPEIFGYSAYRNVFAFPDCAPCSRRTGCPHDMKCMTAITPRAVAAAALETLARPSSRPLPHSTAFLP